MVIRLSRARSNVQRCCAEPGPNRHKLLGNVGPGSAAHCRKDAALRPGRERGVWRRALSRHHCERNDGAWGNSFAPRHPGCRRRTRLSRSSAHQGTFVADLQRFRTI